MAHEFESGLFYGESAWHKLGVTLPEDSPERFSVADSMRLSGMEWNVGLSAVSVNGQEVPAYRAVVRDDSQAVLGIVGDKYRCLQNAELFQWFQPFLDTKEVAFETCGSLRGGALVWVLAKLQRDDAVVRQNDTIRKYLLLTSSHDGSAATSCGFNPVRVVCANTLAMALGNGSAMLKIRHTAKQNDALSAARECINLANESFEATALQYRRLADCKISAADLRKYVKLVFELADDESTYSTRQANILSKVIGLCVAGIGTDGSTAWDALNGISEYATHQYGRNAESRLKAVWYGESAKLNSRALSVALQLAG